MTNKTIINTSVISNKKAHVAIKNNVEYSVCNKTHACVVTNKLNNKQVKIDKTYINQMIKLSKAKKLDDIRIAFNAMNKEIKLFSILQCDAKAKKQLLCKNTAYDSKYSLFAIINSIAKNDTSMQVYNKKASVEVIKKAVKKAVKKTNKQKKSIANKKK